MVEQLGTSRPRAGRARAGAALAALIFALSLFGCGGGDGDDRAGDDGAAVTTPAPEPASLSHEEIVAEGDAICAEVNAAIGGLAAADVSPAIQLSQRTELYTGMVERLRGLDSDDPELTAVFSAGRDLVQAAAAASEAAGRGDTEATVAAETTVTAALASFRAAAGDYGFTECGGPPSTPVSPGSAGGGEDSGTAPVEPTPSEPTPEPAAPPAGGAAAGEGGTAGPGDAGTDGGTAAGPDGDGGAGQGGGAGGQGGGDSSTGGFSPG